MPTLLLRFRARVHHPRLPVHWIGSGPLFHRWLPDGEKDAIPLDTGEPDVELRVWFERLGFVDDLVTGLDSKLIAIEQARYHLSSQGLPDVGTEDIVVVLDREQGAGEKAAAAGLRLHRLIPFRTRGIDWLRDALAPAEHEVLSGYLADPEAYQAPDRRAEVIAMAP